MTKQEPESTDVETQDAEVEKQNVTAQKPFINYKSMADKHFEMRRGLDNAPTKNFFNK